MRKKERLRVNETLMKVQRDLACSYMASRAVRVILRHREMIMGAAAAECQEQERKQRNGRWDDVQ
jgi:hypothetical protein